MNNDYQVKTTKKTMKSLKNKWSIALLLSFGKVNLRNVKLNVILFLLICLGVNVGNLWGQVSNYTYSTTTGTYTAITGTTWQSGTTIGTNAVSGAINLPWSFRYNGKDYSQIYISNNGFITFGVATATTVYTPISQSSQSSTTTNAYDGAISPFGANLVHSTVSGAAPSIIYGSSGSDFVIQFTDLARTGQGAAERFSFQIRLTQTTNVITYHYGGTISSTSTNTAQYPQVGLRGASLRDWRNLTSAVSATAWSAPTSQASNGTASSTSSIAFRNTSLITAGLKYVFTPPTQLSTPSYASLPALTDFTTWSNGMSTGDLPGANWRTWPSFGDRSWRISGLTAGTGNGWSTTTGNPSIASPASGTVAMFNSYDAVGSGTGYMDYYLNFSSTGTKILTFDCINNLGTDILKVYLSTDGGATFGSNLSALTAGTPTTWTTQTINLGSSTSSTCVLRIEGTADYGGTGSNISIDNVNVTVPTPSCASTPSPTSGATGVTLTPTLSWATVAGATGYDVYYGTTSGALTLVSTNQAGTTYTPSSLTASQTYYWKVVPVNSYGNRATGCSEWNFQAQSAVATVTTSTSSLSAFSGCYNTATTSQSFTVSGIYLGSNDISITAPTGFDVSLNNSTWYTGSSMPALVQSGGTVATTTIYVRMSALTTTPSSGNVTCTSGAVSQNVSVSGTVSVISAPTSVTGSGPICLGTATALNATSAGNSIKWYDASTGGTLLGTSASGVDFSYTPLAAGSSTYYAEATSDVIAGSQTFSYTGAITTWTVPTGVNSISISAKGASGGYKSGFTPGYGASMTGSFAVTPGQVLSILVGQSPGLTSAYPGGGGGTYVALGATYSTATPLIVAGGGGGANSANGVGGVTTTSGTGTTPGTLGNGAAASSCGGGGGGFYTSGANDLLYTYAGGAGFQQGGAGGIGATSSYQNGGFGGGACADFAGSCNVTAGAAGGYSGGSGTGTSSQGYGEAGGSYNGGTSQTNLANNNNGNGQVIISWAGVTGCSSSSRTAIASPVVVNTSAIVTLASSNPAVVAGNIGASTTKNPVYNFTLAVNNNGINATLSQLAFTTTNTSASDITKYQLWYNSSNSLATATQIGTDITTSLGTGSHTFSSLSQTINSNTTGYFWITVDGATSVTYGNTMSVAAITTSNLTMSYSNSCGSITGTASAGGTQTFACLSPLSGTYSVGSGRTYATITAALFSLNNCGVSGPVIFELYDASYSSSETFPLTINTISGASSTNTITFRPASGVSTTITSANSSATFKLYGSDYIIIDGSNNGSSTRNLTISNTYAISSIASSIWLASNGASNGATNNVIKNCNVSGTGPTTAMTYAGILSSSGALYSSAAETPNSNNTYNNNNITAVNNGIVLWGNSSNDASTAITNNVIGSSTAASKITYTGLFISNQSSINVLGNTVSGVSANANISFVTGIYVTGTISGGSITNNIVSDVKNALARQAYGIMLNSSSTTGNVTLSNNMVYDINCLGTNATLTRGAHGIVITTGGGYNLYYNTVNLNTSNVSSTATGISAAFYIASGVTALDVRNNIFSNSQSLTTRYSIYSEAANTAFSTIDYNNYYSSGTDLGYIGSVRTLLADIVTGFGQNANSTSVSPTFNSSTDMHLSPSASTNSGLDNTGTASNLGITTDIDGDTRPASANTDMGADEFSLTGCTSANGGTISSLVSSFCTSGTTTLSSTGYSIGIGSSYQWESSSTLAFTSPTNLGSSLSTYASASTGTISSTTYYRLKASCSGSDAYSNIITITVYTPATVTPSSSVSICSGGNTTLTASGASTYTWSPSTGLSGTTGSSVTANPTSTITYSIVGVDANGCTTATATTTVTVNSTPPAITASQSPSSVCAGDVTTLTSTGGIFPLTAADYAVSVSSGATLNSVTSPDGTLIAANTDDVASSVTNIGFNFTFAGTTYTQFWVNSNGVVGFSNTPFSTATNTLTAATNYPVLLPFNDDLGTHLGGITYKLTGTAPNRILTIDFQAGPCCGSASAATVVFQVVLTETTNTVRFIYNIGVTSGRTGSAGIASSSSKYISFNTSNNSYSTSVESNGNTTLPASGTSYLFSPQISTISWSPTTELYTDIAATTTYTGTHATTVYAKNTSATLYTVTAANGTCTSTNTVTTSINALPTITLGSSTPVCNGGTSSSLSYSATTGSPNQYTIDFDATAEGQGFADVTTFTSLPSSPISLVVPTGATPETYNGTVTVKNSTTGCVSTTYSFTVTINSPVNISTQPNNSVSTAGSDAIFTVVATGTGLTYQWQISTNSGSSWSNISGANNASYTEVGVTLGMSGYQYKCIISGASPCTSVTSNVATLTISSTAITAQPASTSICSNGTATFTIATSGTAPTYQWQISTNGGSSWSDISGETGTSLVLSGLTSANSTEQYRCALNSGAINSDAAVLTVYDVVAISTQPTNQTVCLNAANATFTVSATGSGLTYQWQVSTNGGSTWANASGSSTSASYVISTLTTSLDQNQYKVIVSGSSPCSSVTSNAVTLSVTGVSISTSASTVCANSNVTLTSTSTGSSPSFTYSWSSAAGSGASTPITTNPAVITPSVGGSYTYTLTATATSGGCVVTSTQGITVNAEPSITTATATPSSLCAGSTISLAGTLLGISTGTAPIGAGGSTGSSTAQTVFPGSWGGAKSQFLFRSSDLTTAGLTSGNITSLAFEPTSSGQTYQGFYVYINTTASTTLNSTFESLGTLVYVGTLANEGFTPSSNTVNTLNFGTGSGTSSNFNWDGSSNLIVTFSWSRVPTASTSTASSMKYDVVGYTCTNYKQADTQTPAGMRDQTAGTTSTSRPKITFGGQVSTNQAASYNWSWNTSPTVSAATGTTTAVNNTASPISTTYTVTATNPSTGCSSSLSTSSVTINPIPAAPTANNSTQCGIGIPTGSIASNSGLISPNLNWYTNAGATTFASLKYTGSLLSFYSNNFSSNTGTGVLSGNASLTSGSVQLTADLSNQLGALMIPATGVTADKYNTTFNLATSNNSGADGLSYSFGDDVSATSTSTQAEHGNGSKLSVAFDAYGTGNGAAGIRIIYGNAITDPGTTVGVNNILAYSSSVSWLNANVPVEIDINNLGQLTLTLNSVAIFSNVQLPASYINADKSTWKHCFKARTGGLSMQQVIDNVDIKQSAAPTTYPSSIATTTTFYITETSAGCTSSITPITFTVVTAPTISATASIGTVCAGSPTTLTASSSNAGYSYTWSNSLGTGSSVVASPSTATTYTVTANDVSGGANDGCTTTTTVSVAVSITPSAISISPTSSTLCSNGIETIVASGGIVPYSNSQNFSSSGTPAGWTLTSPSGMVVSVNATGYAGGTANELVFDYTSTNSNATAIAQLPVIDATNISSLSISFKSFLDNYSATTYPYSIKLQTSTNNSTWSDAWSFTPSGTTTYTPNTQTVSLTALNGVSTAYLRFAFIGNTFGINYWYVDDINITGTSIFAPTWTPTTGLYTDVAATVAYTGTSTSTVYAKPLSTNTYTATSTAGSGCTSTNTVQVTVRPQFTPGAIASIGETLCVGVDQANITSSTAASGGDNSITYEWRANGTPLASTNSATYDPGAATTTTTYTRWAKDATCNTTFEQSTGSWAVTVGTPSSVSTLSNGDFLWTGTISSDWATTANWRQWNGSAYTVPSGYPNTSSDNVFLPSTSSCVVNSANLNASTVSVNNITIESGHTFTLNNASSVLNIAGSLTNNGTWATPTIGSTVSFNGAGVQTIPAMNYYNLQTATGGTKTLAGTTNVSGVATIGASSTLSLGASTLNLSYIGTPIVITGTFTPSTGTVNYSGLGSQNVVSAAYYNLGTTGAGTKTLAGTVSVSNSLDLVDGTLTLGANTFNMNGSTITRTSGSIDASNSSATLVFGNSSLLTLPSSVFSTTINNLTLTNSRVLASSDITVNGILNLNHANPDATNGLLDLVQSYGSYGNSSSYDGTSTYNDLNSVVLTLGSSATVTGSGDVSGKVRRTSFSNGVSYAFGNKNMQITFDQNGGASLPSQITVVSTKGNEGLHVDKDGTSDYSTGDELIGGAAVKRLVQILRTGGSPEVLFTARFPYEDSELNSNTEANLVVWNHHIPYSGRTPHEQGQTNLDVSNNWIESSGHGLEYLATEGSTSNTKYWMLGQKETTVPMWLGSATGSLAGAWNTPSNWSSGVVPTDVSIIIPNATKTENDPDATMLPSTISLATIEIQSGGVLNGGSSEITLTGGPAANSGRGSWLNNGTFNAGTGKVIFDYTGSTISGTTTFNDITINSGKQVTIQANSNNSISGLITNDGIFDATSNANTITYNGSGQVVIQPNGSTPGYSSLKIDQQSSGTASASGQINVLDTLIIYNGTFDMLGADLFVEGDFINNSSIVNNAQVYMSGTGSQSIEGSSPTTFEILLVTGASGTTTINQDINVNQVLFVESTKTLNGGNSEIKLLNSVTPIILGDVYGTEVFNPNLFNAGTGTVNYTSTDATDILPITYYNLKSEGSVTKPLIGNTVVSNQLSLNGTDLDLVTYKLTIAGSGATSPVVSNGGMLNVQNGELEMTNTSGLTLPANFFNGAVNDLTLIGAGGITLSSDFTLTGDLTLTNGTLTLGSNDMTVESDATISRTSGLVNIGTGGLIYKAASLNMANFNTSAIDHIELDRAGGTITLGGNLSVTNAFTLTDGTFDIASNTLSFNGSIAHSAGTIDADAGTVNFNNASPYTISSGLFAGAIYGLGANGGELTLSEPTTVSNMLTMGGSNINSSDANVLEIGTSKTNPGSISWTTGTITGPLKRWFGTSANSTQASGIFPVGTTDYNRYAQINFTESTPGGYLVIKYVDGTPANAYAGLPFAFTENSANKYIQNADEDGYWEMTPYSESGVAYGALDDKTYDLFLRINNPYSVQNGGILGNPPGVRLIRAKGHANGTHDDWTMAGTYTATTPYTIGEDYKVGAGGVVGFSWFNGGGDNQNPLPVELLSFTGNCENEQVTLNWKTASEHQSAYFEVEKSRNGQDWSVVKTQPAAGYSTEKLEYSYVDENSSNDYSYYRLTQVDENGKSETFNTILVSCDVNSEIFKTLPNPSASSFQVLVNNKSLVGKATINMVDTKGTIVSKMEIEVVDGVNVFYLNENVAPGIYYISISNGVNSTEVIKHSIR